MIVAGRVSWFKLDKKFGFVALPNGEAFLPASVLERAGYLSVPAGTTMRVEVTEQDGRRQVIDVFGIDTATALPGTPGPVRRVGPTREAGGYPGAGRAKRSIGGPGAS